MSIFKPLCLGLLAGALALAGCKHSPDATQTSALDVKPEGARLSAADAIRIAKQTAEHQGVALRNYKEPEAHYEFTRKDHSWWIFFDGRVAMPGNHFAVSVDDRTGGTHFIPGR